MLEPYVLSALASMFAAIFIAMSGYILMVCVKRMGRISEDLRRSVSVIETFGPDASRHCSVCHNSLVSQSMDRAE